MIYFRNLYEFLHSEKNYSFLALNLNCQNQKRKKHISPALGKSPRNEKCHFPNTGEIPSAGSPQTVYEDLENNSSSTLKCILLVIKGGADRQTDLICKLKISFGR